MSVIFHVKNKFNLHGFSMMPCLQPEISLQYKENLKRSVCHISQQDLIELYKYPLIIDMKNHIEENYGVRISRVTCNLYKNGEFCPYKNSGENNSGIFMISVGDSRFLTTKSNDNKHIEEYLLSDGDLLFMNGEFAKNHKYSIPRSSNTTEPHINIIYYIKG
jgi:alkylated DNA repair dioxygenase AlkB